MLHCSRFFNGSAPSGVFQCRSSHQAKSTKPAGQRKALLSPGLCAPSRNTPTGACTTHKASSYVTLAEIKKLVMTASPMVVVDAKTGEDLTRSILLQIILEEESAGVPMFSEAVLSNIIRFYGHAMQGHMGSYLESHVQSFMDWQSKLSESSPALSPEVWAQFMQWQTPHDAKHVFWLGQSLAKRDDADARADAKTDPEEHRTDLGCHGFEDLMGAGCPFVTTPDVFAGTMGA